MATKAKRPKRVESFDARYNRMVSCGWRAIQRQMATGGFQHRRTLMAAIMVQDVLSHYEKWIKERFPTGSEVRFRYKNSAGESKVGSGRMSQYQLPAGDIPTFGFTLEISDELAAELPAVARKMHQPPGVEVWVLSLLPMYIFEPDATEGETR